MSRTKKTTYQALVGLIAKLKQDPVFRRHRVRWRTVIVETGRSLEIPTYLYRVDDFKEHPRWRVSISRQGNRLSDTFQDRAFGGPEAACVEALNALHAILSELPPERSRASMGRRPGARVTRREPTRALVCPL